MEQNTLVIAENVILVKDSGTVFSLSSDGELEFSLGNVNEVLYTEVSRSGSVASGDMTLAEPINATLKSVDGKVLLSVAWNELDILGKFENGNLVFPFTSSTLTLTPAAPLPPLSTGVRRCSLIHLTHGKYVSQQTFADMIEEKLTGIFPGSVVTVTSNVNTLSLESDKASGNLSEKICFLTDEDMKDRNTFIEQGGVLSEQLNSGNVWIGNKSGNEIPEEIFETGIVSLPKDINTVYLHSDTIAGFRNTLGPVPGSRATIAKISMKSTAFGEYHSESLYRPHLYHTFPRTDLSRIDFALRDSRGVTIDLGETNLAFVLTFDDSHLA